jgi:hypothetical protein
MMPFIRYCSIDSEPCSPQPTLSSRPCRHVSARNALSFLRTNTTLKSLRVAFPRSFVRPQKGKRCLRLPSGSCDNDGGEPFFLESLIISTDCNIKFEELLALVYGEITLPDRRDRQRASVRMPFFLGIQQRYTETAFVTCPVNASCTTVCLCMYQQQSESSSFRRATSSLIL